MDTAEIDRTIHEVERLYHSLTGSRPPEQDASHNVIPPEVDPSEYIHAQIGRLLGVLASPNAAETAPNWSPRSQLWEAEGEYLVIVDLPGVPRSAVQVSVVGRALLIHGERPPPTAVDPERYEARVQEAPGGSFQRLIPLPVDALVDDILAEVKDGCLELRFPRERAVVRNVEVH